MSSLKESLARLNEIDLNDLNELDLENMGSWPVPVKVFMCVLTFVLVLVAGHYLYVSELNDRLASEERTETELRDQFRIKAFQAANLQAYRSQMDEMKVTFGALLKQLPSDTEVPGLLEDITSSGLTAGLDIKSINLEPEVSHEFYIELPIDINVAGGYHDLGNFVSGVAGLPRIVTLHDFTIKNEGGEGAAGRLSMNIKARTYRYHEQDGGA